MIKNSGLKLHVISHTHWDREWYQTFEGFRKRLVLMMDDLIETLESNNAYRHFLLDGQTIMIEDYLAIRPENEPRIRKLMQDGRLVAGPWYVMPDEFLVSGESLVRNLQHGRAMAKAYGGTPANCGYVVDIFGHNSQFPQILQGFGIGSAMLFRGNGNYPRDTFLWQAKDGSEVLCANLDPDRCYSNFYFAVRWPFDGREYDADELVRRMEELLEYAKARAVSCNLVMMDGVDHIEAEHRLPWILQTLRERIPGIEITHTTLDNYFRAQRQDATGLGTLTGELYSCGKKGLNNGVLKNVLSSMVHLKQLNDECERRLTRWAEPFTLASQGLARGDMNGLIRFAWKTLMQNHPHDSICGCSITRVHEDNRYRFNQVMDGTDEVIGHALQAIAGSVDTLRAGTDHAFVLFNPMQTEFTGVAEVELELPVGYPDSFLLLDADGQSLPYQVNDVTLSTTKGVFKFGVLPSFSEIRKVRLAFDAKVPPVGYATWWLAAKPIVYPGAGQYSYQEFNPVVRHRGTLLSGFDTWENEYLEVRLQGNGSLAVRHKATGKVYENLGLFEDGGDKGDGWNFRKPAHDTVHYSAGCHADVSVDADGPMLTRWRVRLAMYVPSGLDAGETRRASETLPMIITTTITLRKASSRLEFNTQVDNCAVGHRLRVLFPTAMEAESYFASTPFSLEQRSIRFEDTSAFQEEETFVMPNQGFVALGDGRGMLAVYNKGLYEVQVTDDASRTVALTLFRSFTHEVGQDECKLGKMLMPMSFDYALEFAAAGTPAAALLLQAEAWRAGLRHVTLPVQAGTLPVCHCSLSVCAESTIMSCMKQADSNPGMLLIRLYNPCGKEDAVELKFDRAVTSAKILDLDEQPVCDAAYDGTAVKLQVGKWKIVSVGVCLQARIAANGN